MRRITSAVPKSARSFSVLVVMLLAVVVSGSGCGTFVAHRMFQSSNRYPTWFVSSPPVLLAYDEHLLTNSPVRFADVGPPSARLQYRVIEPADYQMQTSSTNWVKRGKTKHQFTFRGEVPPRTNIWTTNPRGTVFLLHGYSLSEFSMAPMGMATRAERLALRAGRFAGTRRVHRQDDLLGTHRVAGHDPTARSSPQIR